MNMAGLIPARSGSKRVPGKNVRLLAGHPLLAYSVCAARDSGVFSRVILSTDSEEYAEIGRTYGAEVPFLRPAELASDSARDIEWIAHLLPLLDPVPDAFAILRPTSPFRKAETIRRAFREFAEDDGSDSLRAVQPVSEHPGKMWVIDGERMSPLLPLGDPRAPWHSSATQSLPKVWVQNASLEMAWTRVVMEQGTIAGRVVRPFLTQGDEGLDVNSELDWLMAQVMLDQGMASLPPVSQV